MHNGRPLFVAGNGPSLKELDFELLRGRDWLGMNAAYRYWDRVGVYPTLYCCLDKVLIRSHAQEIRRLHQEGRIERFFLVRDILEELPDFPCDDRVFFLEDMASTDAPGTEIFRTAFSDKKTTGSWAVRFAIFLGYRDIALGGIDCSYVEVIREATPTGVGLELKIDAEVASNPNYFFDDYQRQGDTYQVPNPARHFGNLHLQSFEALNHDIARLGLDVRIRNTARGSQLHRFGVYEYLPLANALEQPMLQALAVPLTAGELPQLLEVLALWSEPAFVPLRPDSPLRGRIDLRLFFDGEPSDPIVEAVQRAWATLGEVRACFRGLDITFLGIPADLNRYVRDPKQRDAPRKLGPNLHFLATMRECRGYRYTQLMETDCVPAKADWLTDLDALCRAAEPFWIGGAFLPELGPLDPVFAQHLNGNALYATGDRAFQRFLEETFVPALRYLIVERGDVDLAYDCLVAKLAASVGSSDATLRRYAAEVQRNLHRFRALSAIANLSLQEAALDETALLQVLDEERVLVHSRRLAGLLFAARGAAQRTHGQDVGHPALRRRLQDTFLKIPAGTIHAFHCYTNREGCTVERFDRARGRAVLAFDGGDAPSREQGAFMVFAVHSPTRGRQLECRVEIASEASQRLLVKFARQGDGAFVEDMAEVAVDPGTPAALRLRLDCKDDYARVRLFVASLDGTPGTVRLSAQVSDPAVDEASCTISAGPPGSDLGVLFDSFRKRVSAPLIPLFASRPEGLPRLLVVDSTPLGHTSATGQLKKVFLEGWPDEALLQVWLDGQTLRLLRPRQGAQRSRAIAYSVEEIVQRCAEFRPDVLYFRPIDSVVLFEVVRRVRERVQTPLVIHMMDDWPTRLARQDVDRHAELDGSLRAMVSGAQQLLAISDAMAERYRQRYGGQWRPLANGADPERFPGLPRPSRDPSRPFVLRYMGALADDMTYASVCDVARAVSRLASRMPVAMEIHTMDWCRAKAEQEIGSLPGVDVRPLVAQDQYERSLADAGALLIAYNFDPASIDYIGLSLANKMPECLASGSPVLAYGPREVATIEYLASEGVAAVVDRRADEALEAAIERLATDPDYCASLAQVARDHVRARLTLEHVRERFRTAMREAWAVGPFPREACAHYDETDCVAALFDGLLDGAVMVDVGAHHGHALFPFLERGWRVFAFEPDDRNREVLEKRLADKGVAAAAIRVDKRAVSDQIRTGLAYYRSDQSTGISGLSAFHPSHESRQTVDTTTLTEALALDEIERVDFLKIDTEGHDLFVLKGFPWERFRPAVIECEFEDAKTVPLGYTYHDLARFLQERGYQVYVSEWHPIIRYGIRHDWRRLAPYPCELSDPAAWGNLLAFREQLSGPALAIALGKLLEVRASDPAADQPADSLLVRVPRRFRLLTDPAFRRLGPSLWRYRQGGDAGRCHWMAIVDQPGETAGRTFAAGMRLRVSAPVTVKASLARLGGGAYEGVTQRIDLAPGEWRHLRFCLPFEASHPALKLQFYIEGLGEGQHVDVMADSLCLEDIPEALAADFLEGALDLRVTNRLLRDGKAEEAVAAYRLLFGQHPLRIYQDNADIAQALREHP